MMTNGLICFAHKAVVSGQILFFFTTASHRDTANGGDGGICATQ